jgi:hypothetical protein
MNELLGWLLGIVLVVIVSLWYLSDGDDDAL